MSTERENEIDLSTVSVLPQLPASLRPNHQSALPDDFEGAVIVRFGAVDSEEKPEGGGLVIDYRKPESSEVRRVVLAFNELGMWVEYAGSLESTTIPA